MIINAESCLLYTSTIRETELTQYISTEHPAGTADDKRCAAQKMCIRDSCALWLYNNCVGWLTFLSAAIPPVGGVIIADYLMNRRRYEHFATTRMMSVNWGSILAVALGIALIAVVISVLNNFFVSHYAVSYTHLDVYKRQVLLRTRYSRAAYLT